jgi:uncharacterized protein (TIRG00374 family)
MKKLLVGIILSAIFVYFSLRGLEYEKVLAGLKNVNYFYLLPAALISIIVSVLRSLRWGLILSPVKHVGQRELFPICCVGFMAVVLAPMRMGEFMRPYLLKSRDLVPFSSALATIFVERVLDAMTVLGIFLIVVWGMPVPAWLEKSGYFALSALAAMIVFAVFLYFRTTTTVKFLGPLLGLLPDSARQKVEDLIHNFVDGFKIIANLKRLMATIAISATVWILTGVMIYSLFYFQGFELSLLPAYLVLVVNVIGISLPTAPGMLGNFQFACIAALSLFGVPKDEAFVFSMVFYFLGIGTIILLGLVSLNFVDVSIRGAIRDIRKGFSP